MEERKKALLSAVLSVDAINSLYHLELGKSTVRGELHDFYEMVYVERGFYYVILDGVRYTVEPGSVIFFAPNAFHSGDGITRSDATVDIISFDCTSELMRNFDNCVFSLNEVQRAELAAVFGRAGSVLERQRGGVVARRDADAVGMQMLKGQLELFLLGLYASGGGKSGPVGRNEYRKQMFRRVSDYMKRNLSQRLMLADIAAACSVSEASLKGLCREFCGCGPIEYLISLRILAAKELIRAGGMNFSEIAVRTGFVTLHYFSRVFKSRTGMSPRAYAAMP